MTTGGCLPRFLSPASIGRLLGLSADTVRRRALEHLEEFRDYFWTKPAGHGQMRIRVSAIKSLLLEPRDPK